VIDPETRDVGVYRSGKNTYVVQSSDELTGEDVLPGFRCPVKQLFNIPGQKAT
jgi:Uma2 family endonuclease